MADRPAWVAQYMPELQRRGVSASAALREFRRPAAQGGLGLSISTSTWYKQWGQTLAQLAQREGFLAVNLSRRPSTEQITEFTSRKATGYHYSFNVLVKNNATGETYYTPSGYRSQQLVSFAKARNAAIDALTQAAAEGSPSVADLDILGAVPIGVTEYVPGE